MARSSCRRCAQRASVICAQAIGGVILIARPPGASAYTDKVSTTPIIIQNNMGPSGDDLPYDGEEYCIPTAVSMSLSYLGVNGFNELAPSSPTAAGELNLDIVMSGLMGTTPIGGTSGSGKLTGIKTYLAAEGIGTSGYTLQSYTSPTVSEMASVNLNQTVIDVTIGWYNSSDTRTGGHELALLNQGVNITGASSPNTIVVNNPEPSTVAPYPDIPADSLQYLNTIPTSGGLTSDGAIELDPAQYSDYNGSTTPVIESMSALTVNASELSSNDPTPATWTLSAGQDLNLNGGSLSVLAPLAGAGGISTTTGGIVQLTAGDAATGANTLAIGTLASSSTSATPFGTGAISISSGQLLLNAVGSSPLNQTIAGGSGNQLSFAGGSVLEMNRQGESSMTLTIGGNTSGSTANLVRQSGGTLQIIAGDGNSALGSQEVLLVAGTGANLPALTNGIVSPYIVAESPTSGSGDFLTYGSVGFAQASYTSSTTTPIGSALSTAVYAAESSQTLASSATNQVYAIKVDGVTVGGGASSTLQVGNQSSGQGGVILNGGTIGTPNLAFGSAEGVVYSSAAGGTISSAIQGSGGLTTFGPGSLTLSGANTYSGTTTINNTLVAANASGSATGSSAVVVQPNGTFVLSGASSRAGTGGTTVDQGGTLLLNGGTLAGTLSLSGTIQGHGTVSGAATLTGTISAGSAPDDIDFTGKVTATSATTYTWYLNSLDDNPADAGTSWSLLSFTGSTSTVNFGSSGNSVNWTSSFSTSIADPNSGVPFWNESHTWEATYMKVKSYSDYWSDDFPVFSQGHFSISSSGGSQYVNYTPYSTPKGATAATWANAAGGTWSTSGNWLESIIPEAVGDTANFTSSAVGPSTVTLNSNWTLGNLYFDNTNSYTLSPGSGGQLTLANGIPNAAVTDAGGTHYIAAPVVLDSSATVTVSNSGDLLDITGAISGAGGLTTAGNGTIALGGSNTYQGTTTVGNTLLRAAAGAIPQGSIVAVSSGAELQLGASFGGLTMSSLSISAGGVLDIANNHIIVDYTSSDPISTISGYLASGFNNGGWNGSGIISSTAQTPTNGLRYGVGWADGADKIVSGLTSGQIEIKYTLLGDANLDGVVNGSDFSILAANFGQGATDWDQGNFLFTPAVNGSDFSALAANFGQGDSGADTPVSAADIAALDSFAVANDLPIPTFASIPEPAGGFMLLCAAAGTLRRRRCRK